MADDRKDKVSKIKDLYNKLVDFKLDENDVENNNEEEMQSVKENTVESVDEVTENSLDSETQPEDVEEIKEESNSKNIEEIPQNQEVVSQENEIETYINDEEEPEFHEPIQGNNLYTAKTTDESQEIDVQSVYEEPQNVDIESTDEEIKEPEESQKKTPNVVENSNLLKLENADLNNEKIESSQQTSIDTENYGEVLEVFSRAKVATFSIDDPRVPTTITKPTGTISQFGDTLGGVDFTISATTNNTVEEGMYIFQGTAKADFVLTGNVLDAIATVSLVTAFDEHTVKFMGNGTQATVTTITGSLRDFIVKAANEAIDDINGIRTPAGMDSNPKAPAGIPNITHRAHLARALRSVFATNGGTNGNTGDVVPSNIPSLRLTFKDLDDLDPKQITLTYHGPTFFPTDVDYLRNIINQDSLINNFGDIRSRNRSNVKLNAERIGIRFNIQSKDASKGLKTNTNYKFIALNKSVSFYPKDTVTTVAECLEGFSMKDFKTAKQLPLFETYTVSGIDGSLGFSTISTIAISSLFSAVSAVSYLMTSIDFYSINNDSTFIDYDNMVSATASDVALKIDGTSIQFKTFKIFDKDETITKMEMEDDRNNKYPASVSLINEDKLECGGYLKVTGLQRSTPYLFRKLHITATPEQESLTKTFDLVTLSYSSAKTLLLKQKSSSGKMVTAVPHNITLRTTNFSEPKLFIELDPEKLYVDSTGSFSSTPSSNTLVFIPKLDVKLPNNLIMPAVKNDKTALRYVIEVENNGVNVKNLTVNGLKGDEQYKVERIDGKDKTYFILTLFNLSENRDYGFLILELSYTDLDDRELITRQVLSGINVITDVPLSSGANSGMIMQFPDQTLDNKTGPELMGTEAFNVTLFSTTTLEARKADIPVLIDDLNGRFLRMEFNKPESNPNVELELDGSLLRFTNLTPKTEVVYKVDFIWRDKDNKEQVLSKYAKISTPQVPTVDVRSTNITTTDKTAEIKFMLYGEPKSTIKEVILSDENIKYTWDSLTLTLNLTGLKPETEYKDLEITFKLESGLASSYKIDTFKTRAEVQPPTGEVAEFVKRVYETALGRAPEVEGWKFWVQKLESKELPATQFIYDLLRQSEFIERYLSKEEFIKVMYQIIVGRDPDEEGQKFWEGRYDEYQQKAGSLADLRVMIASDMMGSEEFKKYITSLGIKY